MSYIPIATRQDGIDPNAAADINQLNDNIADVNRRLGSKIGLIDFQYFVPSNAMQLNGALKSRTTYADLWAKIQLSISPIADATWLGGEVGNFSAGDGSTTFRLSDFSGLFPRFAGANSVMTMSDGNDFDGGASLSVALDKMQTITGSVSRLGTAKSGSAAGCFSLTTSATDGWDNNTDNEDFRTVTFNSANSPNARTGAETAPARISLIPIIYFED